MVFPHKHLSLPEWHEWFARHANGQVKQYKPHLYFYHQVIRDNLVDLWLYRKFFAHLWN